MLNESSSEEARQVTDFQNRSALVKAKHLWFDDLGQYTAFVHEGSIITGEISDICHRYGEDEDYGVKRKRIGLTIKRKLVAGSRGLDKVHVNLNPTDDVWILDSEPKVSVNGLYLEDKKRR